MTTPHEAGADVPEQQVDSSRTFIERARIYAGLSLGGTALVLGGCSGETGGDEEVRYGQPGGQTGEILESESSPDKPETIAEPEVQDPERLGSLENPIPVKQSHVVGAWELTFGKTVNEIDGKSVARIISEESYTPAVTVRGDEVRTVISAKLVGNQDGGDYDWHYYEYDEDSPFGRGFILEGLEVALVDGSGREENIHSYTYNDSEESFLQQMPDSFAIGDDAIEGHVHARTRDLKSALWKVQAYAWAKPGDPNADEIGRVWQEPVYFATTAKEGSAQSGVTQPETQPETSPESPMEPMEIMDWQVNVTDKLKRGKEVEDLLEKAYGTDRREGQVAENHGYVAVPVKADNLDGTPGTDLVYHHMNMQLISSRTGEPVGEFSGVLTPDGEDAYFAYTETPHANQDGNVLFRVNFNDLEGGVEFRVESWAADTRVFPVEQ